MKRVPVGVADQGETQPRPADATVARHDAALLAMVGDLVREQPAPDLGIAGKLLVRREHRAIGPHQFVALVAEDLAQRRVDLGEGAVVRMDRQAQRGAIEHAAKTIVAAVAGNRARERQSPGLGAQLELEHDLARQAAQRFALLQAERAGDVVDHAQRAEREPLGGDERGAGVEPDRRVGRGERVVGETGVGQRVRHHQEVGVEDGVGAEGEPARGFGRREAHAGLEPLALGVDQAHERDRRVADLRREPGQVVERGLRRAVEHVECVQCGEALGFVVGFGCLRHLLHARNEYAAAERRLHRSRHAPLHPDRLGRNGCRR